MNDSSDEEQERLISQPLHLKVKYRLTAGRKATMRLLVVLLLERLAFYAITLNISTFAADALGYTSAQVNAIVTVIVGSAYFFAPLFGWISDRKMVFYKILVGAFSFYILASLLVCWSAFDTVHIYATTQPDNGTQNDTNGSSIGSVIERPRVVYLIGLIIMVPCVASIRANLLPYMFVQLGDGGEKRRVISKVVSIYLMIINAGATAAIALGFLQRIPGPGSKSKNTGFFWIFMFTPVTLLLSLGILLRWKNHFRNHTSGQGKPDIQSLFLMACGCCKESKPSPCFNEKTKGYQANQRYLRRRRLAVVMPVFWSLLFYMTVYGQMHGSFSNQARHLGLYNDTVFNKTAYETIFCRNNVVAKQPNYVLPPTIINIFNPGAVVVAIPALWFIIYPIYEHLAGKEFDMLSRILWGIVFSMLALFSAMVVEMKRALVGLYKPTRYAYICTKLLPNHYLRVVPYSPVSLKAQIPQYLLVGIAEALGDIGIMEFLLSRTPKEFTCTVFSLYYAFFGLGIYFGAVLKVVASAFKIYYTSWPDNPRQESFVLPRFDSSQLKTWVYFFVLFVLMAFSSFYFIHVKKKHKDARKYTQERAR